METALIPVERYDLTAVFTNGDLDALLEEVEAQALSLVPDVRTAKGRKEIASQAHKVARSKTLLDKHGKALVAGWKSKAKKVDAERKKARDFLDGLKNRVREPLDTWQAEEDARVGRHAANLEHMKEMFDLQNPPYDLGRELTSDDLKMTLASLEAIAVDDSWEEFESEATRVKAEGVEILTAAIARQEKAEAEAAELARLRKEEEERKAKEEAERLERERKEREERIAREAAKRAVVEAEAKARAEKERLEREKREAEEAAIFAAEQSKRQAEEAVRRERERIEAEQRAEAERKRLEKEAAERKARHHAHVAKIDREITGDIAAIIENDFMDAYPDAMAKGILDAIKEGVVRYLEIKY